LFHYGWWVGYMSSLLYGDEVVVEEIIWWAGVGEFVERAW
jgi:hypothetical protein